jgi:very-short-patch-repair endonuclease
VYDRGKSRTNRREAEAIVADLVRRMQRCLGKPEGQRLTYGVVTFNSQQQALIQDLLDDAQRRHPELEWYFADERFEPTAVKNLENVQGDERDVMLFSITFGFDAAGKFPVDFGAINRDGGERRLNVAVTRARQELVVYASFRPEQLHAERSAARGVHDLKAFLEYADKGPEAIIARVEGSLGDHESPLEEAVAAALEQRGWRVVPQVGVSGFRIDLGVVHPDKPGAYLAGVECDGATYHRAAVARDRDKTRQQVLENLGWSIIRVWSTDWWYDPDAALERLDGLLQQLLQRSREAVPAVAALGPDCRPPDHVADAPEDNAPEEQGLTTESKPLAAPFGDALRTGGPTREPWERPQLVARLDQGPARRVYARIDLGDATANQQRFFDDDYTDTLRGMAVAVLHSHGPIRDDVLAREVARAHGFARTGHKIKQRVLDLLPGVVTTEEPVGRFLWPGTSIQEFVPFRYPSDDEPRSLDEIAIQELIGLVREHDAFPASEDPALALARELGLARLSRTARERLEKALEACDWQERFPPQSSTQSRGGTTDAEDP